MTQRMRVLVAVAAGCLVLAAALPLFADLEGSYILPIDDPAIGYRKLPLTDPVHKLQARLNSGQATLRYRDAHGYLEAVLEALEVPVSSQVLVFSKTSFQAPLISPRTPRALYFNDDVYIGWVKSGEVVEVSSVDPKQGAIFYTLSQDGTEIPRFHRREECEQCHVAPKTLGIPGHLVRSVFPKRDGMALFQAGSFLNDDRSPFSERWGGWYVTGTHKPQLHMGNSFVANESQPDQIDRESGANVTDLSGRFDTGAYLSPHSDIVALMVLQHQTRMHNLITRVGFEARLALHQQRELNRALGRQPDEMSESTQRRIRNAAEELVRYMLFAEEQPLQGRIEGTSTFARDFAAREPRDSNGRSLRQFDLERRLFRYPCSFLIYSASFDAMPEYPKEIVYRRLWEVLSGKDQSKAYARISAADRRAILEILRETKSGLPEYWTSES